MVAQCRAERLACFKIFRLLSAALSQNRRAAIWPGTAHPAALALPSVLRPHEKGEREGLETCSAIAK